MFALFTYAVPILTHVAGVAEAHVGFVPLACAKFAFTPWTAITIVKLRGLLAFAVCAITQAMVVDGSDRRRSTVADNPNGARMN